MMGWSLAIAMVALQVIVVKLAARAAVETKRKLAVEDVHDPVVDALAWIDRMTSFRRA